MAISDGLQDGSGWYSVRLRMLLSNPYLANGIVPDSLDTLQAFPPLACTKRETFSIKKVISAVSRFGCSKSCVR